MVNGRVSILINIAPYNTHTHTYNIYNFYKIFGYNECSSTKTNQPEPSATTPHKTLWLINSMNTSLLLQQDLAQWQLTLISHITQEWEHLLDRITLKKKSWIIDLYLFCQLLEHHVYNHLYMYLTELKLPLDEQSGFRDNLSCETVLLQLTDYFLSNIDQGNLCGMVLVDLRRAFDLVNHELLLLKLDSSGCHGN